MAVTVPSRHAAPFRPLRYARWLRRVVLLTAVLMLAWFFLKFTTRWVPIGMNTVPTMPAGSWLLCDRWSSGLRVGSTVFVDAPFGELLTRVSKMTDEQVWVQNPNDEAAYPDSDEFGPLPIEAVRATVVVTFAPEHKGD